MKSRFTQLASEVLDGSAREARALGHAYIGTEHLLLSLLASGGSAAAGILLSHEITHASTLAVAKEISGEPGESRIDARDMTPRLRSIIESSATEADKYGQSYNGTVHLLLALISSEKALP